MSSLSLGAPGAARVQVLSVRLLIPWTGAWVADCELDPAATLPTGKQLLTIGSATLVCTVETHATGIFGDTKRVRVVAGAGAWGTILQRTHLHNDGGAGVTSTIALGVIAPQIGETVIDPTPVVYGPDWEFLTGPAAAAFEGRQWYVDGNGITQISDWPPLPLDTSATVLMYNPETRRAELAGDEIVWPGTTFTDSRFGTLIAREIDQRFTVDGSKITLWHNDVAQGRFNPLLDAIARRAGPQWLKVYRYRIGLQGGDGRLQLQAVDPTQGQPDTLPISVWPGMSGLSAKYTLGSLCGVIFLEGNKTLPRVVHFDGSTPQEFYIDASVLAHIYAPTVKIGDVAARALAHATEVSVDMAGISAFIAACGTFGAAMKPIVDSLISASGVTAGQISTWDTAKTAFDAAVTAATGIITAEAPTLATTKAMGT